MNGDPSGIKTQLINQNVYFWQCDKAGPINLGLFTLERMMKKIILILVFASILFAGDTAYKKTYDDIIVLKEYYNKRFKIQDDKNSKITITVKADNYLYIKYEADEDGLKVVFDDKILNR